MGRPKKLSFPCSYCDKEFKRKINLNKHLLCHANLTSKTSVARVNPTMCHICRRSFPETEFKLHIETIHKSDNYNMHSANNEDFLPNKKKYFVSTTTNSRRVNKIIPSKLPKKHGKKPGKTFQNVSSNTCLKIKVEPPDTYETNVIILKNKNAASNSSSMTCKLCGFKCKSLRGIKIHLSAIHKKKKDDQCKLKKSLQIHKDLKSASLIEKEPQNDDLGHSPMKTASNSQHLFTTNSVSNINQIVQPSMICNIFPNQPFNNSTNIAYQPNMPNSSFENQNELDFIATIPVFDCESEKYIKWIKNFIGKCKMHEYPLTPLMCRILVHINEEITNALAYPKGAMKKYSNHFYFMRMKSLLSEIMIGQLEYSMNDKR